MTFAAPAGTVLSANTTYYFGLYTTGNVDLETLVPYGIGEPKTPAASPAGASRTDSYWQETNEPSGVGNHGGVGRRGSC